MFTWICPKCGREVGPSYSECPFCAENAAAKPAAPAPPAAAAPPQPQYTPPAPPQPQYQPPPPAPPPVVTPPVPPPPPQQVYYVGADDHKRSIPGWLAALLAFAAVAVIAFGVVYVTRNGRSDPATAAKTAAAEKQKAAGNPYGKFLELTGFRITEAAGKKLKVQFLAVNHGAADLSGIEGVITLQVKADPNAEPACTFKFQIENIPSFGAKEIEVTAFTQKRKFFDMPDWQFLNPVVEFTSTE